MTIDLIEVQRANRRLRDYRQICGKKIIIVEGPAGAGKTTLSQRLVDLGETAIVRGSLGKRSFQITEAGAKSFLNDTNKLQHALLAKESVVFIDRCMASQVVYHAIRTDKEISNPKALSQRTNDLVWSLEKDLAWRLDRIPRDVEVYWLFLSPDPKVLKSRRKESGKKYPHSAENETHRYRKLSNQMALNADLMIRPQFNTEEDTDFIVEAFNRYLDHFPYLDFPTLWKEFAMPRRVA